VKILEEIKNPFKLSSLLLALLLATFPFLGNYYILDLLILSNIYAIFAASFDIISGYAGQISLGHAAYFGLGGYFYGFLIDWFNIPPALSFFLSGILVAIIGFLVGVPCLRLKGAYLALGTLAFSETVRTTILAFPSVTWGQEGLQVNRMLHGIIHNYYASLALLLSSLIIMHYVVKCKLKLYLVALRENEDLAEAVGINTAAYKLLAFTISSFFSAISGAFFASYIGVISPRALTISLSFRAIVMSTIGGIGTLYGPIFGAYLITFLSEAFRPIILRGSDIIYAVLLIIFILLIPKGIVNFIQERLRSFLKL